MIWEQTGSSCEVSYKPLGLYPGWLSAAIRRRTTFAAAITRAPNVDDAPPALTTTHKRKAATLERNVLRKLTKHIQKGFIQLCSIKKR